MLSLGYLNDRSTSRGPLRLGEARPGRYREEEDAVVYAGETPVIRLKSFAGRPSARVPPWIEAGVARDDESFAAELVGLLAGLLPPGGRLMIAYGGDETEVGLKRGFPPVVTPLGKALLDAGCTWFKDWYFPEGWSEGEFKLHGNKPLTGEARDANLAQLRSEVEGWLAAPAPDDDEMLLRARERARSLLGGR